VDVVCECIYLRRNRALVDGKTADHAAQTARPIGCLPFFINIRFVSVPHQVSDVLNVCNAHYRACRYAASTVAVLRTRADAL
jgi:hypothetical protein